MVCFTEYELQQHEELIIKRALAAKDLALAQANRHKDELFQKLAEKDREIAKWVRIRTPTHGNCCTCQKCGLDHDSCRCDLDDVCDELDQLKKALTEKDAELARWKARSWDENVRFIAEAKENLLKEYIRLTELYGEQKHEIRKLKATLAEKAAQLEMMLSIQDNQARLIEHKDTAYQQLLEKAVRFAKRLAVCSNSKLLSFKDVEDFLNSAEVQAWKEWQK